MRSVTQSESIDTNSIIFRKGLLRRKPLPSKSVQEDRPNNQVALEPSDVSILRIITTNQTDNWIFYMIFIVFYQPIFAAAFGKAETSC